MTRRTGRDPIFDRTGQTWLVDDDEFGYRVVVLVLAPSTVNKQLGDNGRVHETLILDGGFYGEDSSNTMAEEWESYRTPWESHKHYARLG